MNLNILDTLMDYTEIKIKFSGDIKHDKDWIEKGNKPDYDLWIILQGELNVEINNTKYSLSAKDMLFLSSQIFYTAYANSNCCEFIYVHFDFKIGNNMNVLDDFAAENPILRYNPNSHIDSFIESYYKYKNKIPLSFLELRGNFHVLLARILASKYDVMNCSYTYQNSLSLALIKIQPVLSYISDHLNESIHIKKLAEIAGFTEKYFITFFRTTLGITPAQYIIKAKMNKALGFIYQGTYSIKEIAYSLGYPDQYTFSKAFKKHYGVSPTKIM